MRLFILSVWSGGGVRAGGGATMVCTHMSSDGSERSADERVGSLRGCTGSRGVRVIGVCRRRVSNTGGVRRERVLKRYLRCYGQRSIGFLLLSRLDELKEAALRILHSLRVLRRSGMSICVRGLKLCALRPGKSIGPVTDVVMAMLTRVTGVREDGVRCHLGDNETGCVCGKNGLNEGANSAGARRGGGRRCGSAVTLLGGKCSIEGITGLRGVKVSAIREVEGRFLDGG